MDVIFILTTGFIYFYGCSDDFMKKTDLVSLGCFAFLAFFFFVWLTHFIYYFGYFTTESHLVKIEEPDITSIPIDWRLLYHEVRLETLDRSWSVRGQLGSKEHVAFYD